MNQGFVWSLMSTDHGGFLEAQAVDNVERVRSNILKGRVLRRFTNEDKFDDDYEFFEEQFLELSDDVLNPKISPHSDKEYKRGERVLVYSRQIWNGVLDNAIPGIVYQDSMRAAHNRPGSVIVSVHPNNFANPAINTVGGSTVEVYPQQLRKVRHNEKFPIAGSNETKYIKGKGFKRAKVFNDSPWYKKIIGQ